MKMSVVINKYVLYGISLRTASDLPSANRSAPVGFGRSRESPKEAAFILAIDCPTSLRRRDWLRIIEAAAVPIRLSAKHQANSFTCKSLECAFLVG